MIVKICGLKRVEDAVLAADCGADLVGLVFAPSRRRVEERTAAEIAGAVHAAGAQTVGVFVDEDPAEMERVARACELDYLQLSGNERDDVVAALDTPVIRVVHVGDESPRALAARLSSAPGAILLLDTARTGVYGGTGEAFDWACVPPLRRPVLLAGGLHPGNLADAIRTVRPWGVDVSSGVETDGEKDRQKIRDFVAVAKENRANVED